MERKELQDKLLECEKLQQQLWAYRPLSAETLKSLREYYRIGLTYTSNATASMIRANLYMEYDGKKDVILQFDPEEVTYVLGEDFIMPTLIMSEQGLELTYTSSHPDVAVIEDGVMYLYL